MVLLVAAAGQELAGVRRYCRRVKRLRWPAEGAWRGELNGQAVVMVANGCGGAQAVDALKTAREREEVEAVVSTGWCGGVAPGLKAGEIFVPERVEPEGGGDGYECQAPRTRRTYRAGRLATVNRVLGSAAEKERLRARGVAAVDMEAAYLAAEAARLGMKFYCVRVVLDEGGESFGLDFEAARGENGRLSKMQILREALARPATGVPELARWARRSRATARALGEFLAECSFGA